MENKQMLKDVGMMGRWSDGVMEKTTQYSNTPILEHVNN
jgi:hypothetical protein